MNTITKNKLDTMFDSHLIDLEYLRDRWQDEKHYEDFADYIEEAKKFIEASGFAFVKLTEGFKITMKDLETNILIMIKINASDVKVQIKEINNKMTTILNQLEENK